MEYYIIKSYWKRAWNTAFNKSGIDKCRIHDLRHTFTSRLIVDEKEDYATVLALTGHKDISMLLIVIQGKKLREALLIKYQV